MSDIEITGEKGIQDLEEQRAKFYLEIGRFVTTFEHILFSFTKCIVFILSHKGLKDTSYSAILLGEATADPIRLALDRMSFYYFEDIPTRNCIRNLLTQFDFLNQIRNKFVHSYWAIGVMVTGERKPIGIGLKRRLSKKGVGMYNISLDYDIMVALNSDMQVFNKMADELQNSVENKETININDIEERLKTLSFKAILDFITNDSHLSYDKDKKSLLGGLMEVLKNGEDQS